MNHLLSSVAVAFAVDSVEASVADFAVDSFHLVVFAPVVVAAAVV